MHIPCLVLACLWTQADVPIVISKPTNIADASFRGIAVRSDSEAWVGGSNGTLMRTTDGGESWEPIAIPDREGLDFRDIELPARHVVVVMAAGPGEKSRVYRSTDSGVTWKVVLQNTNAKGFFNAIAFWDETAGILVGDPIAGRVDIYRTSDGGATWTRLPLANRPRLSEGEYGFAASGTNLTTEGRANAFIATGGSRARLLVTANRGEFWKSMTTPITSGLKSTGIFSVAFRDHQHGVIVGGDYKQPKVDNGNVARIGTAETNFTLVQQRPGIGHKACVRHLTGQKWLAAGRTGVIYTDTDGHRWSKISNESFYTFDADENGGWLAGVDGRVARFKINSK